MSSKSQRVAVVTGGTRGIGGAVAKNFEETGITVIRVARTAKDDTGVRSCDVGDPEQVEKLFSAISAEFGRLDILVNSAAVVSVTPPLEVTAEEWRQTLQTNVVGTYLCCQHAIPLMRRNGGGGKIVNLGSIAGRSHSRTASVAYTASKYAVIGMTRQLASAFGSDQILINCVCPSQTLTETLSANVPVARQRELAANVPLQRLARPDEIANVVSFLASEKSTYMNGAVIDVNGGQL